MKPKSRKDKSKDRVAAYRERLKANKAKYEEIKLKHVLRKFVKRPEEKENLECKIIFQELGQ